MFFEFLTTKNYRQLGDFRINYALPNSPYSDIKYEHSGRNITAIVALNGTGKTTLLNAHEWCLYGKEKHLSDSSKAAPIISAETVKKLNQNEECEVVVEIHALDENDNNRRIIFKRVQPFRIRVHTNGQKMAIPIEHPNANSGSSRFDIYEQKQKNMVPCLKPEDFVSEIAPEKLSECFFYDGARLDGYFKDRSGKNIHEEVLRISQINILERMRDHIKHVSDVILGESKRLNPQTRRVTEKLNNLEATKTKQTEELKNLENSRDGFSEREKEYGDLLGTNKDVKSLQAGRVKLEGELKRIEDILDHLQNQKLYYIKSVAIPILACKHIIQTHKTIIKKIDAGEIPRHYDKDFLEELLREGACICGRSLSKDDPKDDEYRKNISNLFHNCDNITSIQSEVIAVDELLKMNIEKIKSFKGTLAPLEKQIDMVEKEYNDKLGELEKISTDIKKIGGQNDTDTILFWEGKRQEASRLKKESDDKIAVLIVDIGRTEESINTERTNRRREMAKDEKNKLLLEKYDFCEASIKGINKIINEIMQGVRNELEEKTSHTFLDFLELHGKKEVYLGVKILDDYSVSVPHNVFPEGLGHLSQGEMRMLAYSFMSAVSGISGFDVPIIIDSPLANLDGPNKRIIAEHLPHLLKGKQVIILLTDDEYIPDLRDKFCEYVGQEYMMTLKGELVALEDKNIQKKENN